MSDAMQTESFQAGTFQLTSRLEPVAMYVLSLVFLIYGLSHHRAPTASTGFIGAMPYVVSLGLLLRAITRRHVRVRAGTLEISTPWRRSVVPLQDVYSLIWESASEESTTQVADVFLKEDVGFGNPVRFRVPDDRGLKSLDALVRSIQSQRTGANHVA
jgi:hypothetical protein